MADDRGVLERIREHGIVPLATVERADDGPLIVGALSQAGLPVAEIALRTPAALDAIRLAVESWPNALIGAGTVLSVDQARDAVSAGARFIVSPGISPEVVAWCRRWEVACVPGCATPSDLMVAGAHGLQVVKFFPSEALGGLRMLRDLSGPFPTMRFVPTGGIDAGNLGAYLSLASVWACGGSWMLQSDRIEERVHESLAIRDRARGRGHTPGT